MTAAILDFAIVGSGFAGLAMARALHRQGQGRFVILEKAATAGGTWRDNRYPGAACDVPSHLYALSDAANPNWSRLFPEQAEIERYLLTLAQAFIDADQLRFEWHLARASWDADHACWMLQAADGRELRARNLIMAVGGLHHPAWPDIPGREDFRGDSWHAARWPESAELAGKRVAVIGSGASAVQIVPALAGKVAALKVLQRTPSWVLPRPDMAIPGWLRSTFARVPALRLALRGSIFVLLEALSAGLFMPRTAFWARALARRHLRRQVPDPALREQLRPDYPIGCKRVLISSSYYPALSRPDVELVVDPIQRIEAGGIGCQQRGLIEVDTIIYATGFKPMQVLGEVDIRGRDGLSLAEAWTDRPRAHLGISVHGFPNLFFLLGPNTALGHNSVLYMIESQVRHVLSALRLREQSKATAIEATADAQNRFIEMLDRRFSGTAWAGGCHSWYLDDKGRNIALWIGSARAYRRATRRARANDYLLQ